jgi:ornithine lipid hydroxylase
MTNNKIYGNILITLLGLFVMRVAAQLIQATHSVSFLPPFEAWQSGALPYPFLVAFQLIIIAFLGHIAWKFKTQKIQLNPKSGMMYLLIGGIYFSVMAFRVVAGLSFAANHPWLGAHIPAIFHLVLASFLLTVGFYHSPYKKIIIARITYPILISSAVIGHYLCIYNNVNLQISVYVPVLLAALMITYLEKKLPHRSDWQPKQADVVNDASYMLLIQILLPRFLGFLVVITLLETVRIQELTVNSIWPHERPAILQAMLMMIVAEFMRYWLHRLSHNWTPLWQLHAVHHSPQKLYWLNVGRFHPIEKSFQYIFDALPFILLGVSENVLAIYFVFYAINGFFQHCNIELRLGLLNYIISGPELHRWHHSKLIEESNNNYGNNLIIWDVIFGTRYLPADRQVDELGLKNRHYPMKLMAQLTSPFKNNLDKAS